MAGKEQLLGGSRRIGEGVKMAVFSQDLAQDLPLEMPALEYVLQKAREDDPTITAELGRKSLGSLGLAGAGAQRPIGQLSGGEKARVALAAFALIPYNLLLLDEPRCVDAPAYLFNFCLRVRLTDMMLAPPSAATTWMRLPSTRSPRRCRRSRAPSWPSRTTSSLRLG